MKAALVLLALGACVDGPLAIPDTRHVDVPRGAVVEVDAEAIERVASSDPTIATAEIGDDLHALITGHHEGDAVITIGRGDALTTVAAHVTPPAIVRLEIDPPELAPPLGAMIALHAYTTDTMGAIADVSAVVSWVVDDPTIAALEHEGLRGMTVGATMLHARVAGATVALQITVR